MHMHKHWLIDVIASFIWLLCAKKLCTCIHGCGHNVCMHTYTYVCLSVCKSVSAMFTCVHSILAPLLAKWESSRESWKFHSSIVHFPLRERGWTQSGPVQRSSTPVQSPCRDPPHHAGPEPMQANTRQEELIQSSTTLWLTPFLKKKDLNKLYLNMTCLNK